MLGLFIDHNPGRVNQTFAASSSFFDIAHSRFYVLRSRLCFDWRSAIVIASRPPLHPIQPTRNPTTNAYPTQRIPVQRLFTGRPRERLEW